jgi:hypothetical protein
MRLMFFETKDTTKKSFKIRGFGVNNPNGMPKDADRRSLQVMPSMLDYG